MKVDILLGLQWGDEGKGKIVDFLSPNYNIVARYQGGPNAGHTIEFDNKKFVLHLIPSGIFRPQTTNVIGNGVVLDPVIFKKEVDNLNQFTDVKSNLIISNKAHLIIPTHKLLDVAYEKSKGENKIGSTLKGIAPTYTDKIGRKGIRIGDIFEKDFDKKVKSLIDEHAKILNFYNFEYEIDQILDEWFSSLNILKQYKICNTEYFLNEQLKNNKTILAEGAQGTMLDIEFGTYPYVTSSNTISAGTNIGLGIAPQKIDKVFGIFKAYTTRVGSGPFPTELNDETGEKIRKIGNEFGATTGRPRRCGWLDIVVLKYTTMLNGVTDLIMTKADILSGFEQLEVATKYSIDNQITDEIPFNMNVPIEPIYDSFKGWKEDISNITNYANLPENIKSYIINIENFTNSKVSYVSTGANRNSIISR